MPNLQATINYKEEFFGEGGTKVMRQTYKVCRNAFYKLPEAVKPRVHIVMRQTKKKKKNSLRYIQKPSEGKFYNQLVYSMQIGNSYKAVPCLVFFFFHIPQVIVLIPYIILSIQKVTQYACILKILVDEFQCL